MKEKKYLMIDDYTLNKVLDKVIEKTSIEKFDELRFWLMQMISYRMIFL